MNMDMLSRVFDIIQRAGGMEQSWPAYGDRIWSALCVWPFELYSRIPYLTFLDDDLWLPHWCRCRFCRNIYIRCAG